MMPLRFLADLLDNITRRERESPSLFKEFALDSDTSAFAKLLAEDSETLSISLAHAILTRFKSLSRGEKKAFFSVLTEGFAIDGAALASAYGEYQQTPSPRAQARLTQVCEPTRQKILRKLNQAPHGTQALVAMRKELLSFLSEDEQLKALDADFLHLFSSWFNRGFLVLQRIDWNTPAAILEKIIRYEAVHEIRDWQDLRSRLAPDNRLCFAFFHPALLDEPLIFVEVALTHEIADNIEAILSVDAEHNAKKPYNTAVFYSISNCQEGLRGISFGNSLIKHVVKELLLTHPQLNQFVTLSPIPKLRSWLKSEWQTGTLKAQLAGQPELQDFLARLLNLSAAEYQHLDEKSQDYLRQLASWYLVEVKRGKGAWDPVANFHLSNGAELHQINPCANLSARGVEESFSVMVNYLYRLDAFENNHENYSQSGQIEMGKKVKSIKTIIDKKQLEKGQGKAQKKENAKAQKKPHTAPQTWVNQNSTVGNVLFDAFAAQMTKQGDKTLLTLESGEQLSYSQFAHEAQQLAQCLVEYGVQKGDRVAVQIHKCPESVMLYLACLQVGAIYLPLNIDYSIEELSYFLGDATPRLLVMATENRDKGKSALTQAGLVDKSQLETLGRKTGSLFTTAQTREPLLAITPCAADDLAAILYTSGTTGRSKGAMLSHKNLHSNAQALIEAWHYSDSDVLIHALPLFHTHGLFVAFNVSLLSGASLLFLERFNPEKVLALLPQATVLMGVPTFYTRLLAQTGFTRDYVAHMRLFISGSAPLTAETHHAFFERTGQKILERYGMTETNMNTSNPYHGERLAGTVGLPLQGVQVRVADRETGKPLPVGEIGVIEVKGDNILQGYWQMPEKNASEFRTDGFFITGDVGFIDKDNGYISIVGRDKDMIISGGYNVYPKEVEQVLDKVPGVRESAVFGVSHPDFGEGVVAAVVLSGEQPAKHVDASIHAELPKHLARYKQPKKLLFIEELPRNVMGKVQKNILRERYQDLFQ